MKHTISSFLLPLFIAASNATAQSHGPDQYRNPESPYQRMLLKRALDDMDEQAEQRSTPQEKQYQFWMKTEKFIASWTELVNEYNEKGTFNVKKAKQVSKAFHELEKSEGWPKQ